MDSELNDLIAALELYTTMEKEDKIYQYFIDNQISRYTLKILLDYFGYKYEEDLFDKPTWYIKSYRTHSKKQVKFDKNNYYISEKEIFNIVYFKELCHYAKKNKKVTEELMNYSKNLHDIVIHIMTMKNIKLVNLNKYITNSKWQEVATKYDCKTLFDLYREVSPIKQNKDSSLEIVREGLYSYLANSKYFDFDLLVPYNNFCLDMEVLLSSLPTKISNTFRIIFLVYKEEYLEPNEYNSKVSNFRMLISKNKGSLKITDIKNIKKRYGKYIDSFPQNGYRAIYYSLIDEEL